MRMGDASAGNRWRRESERTVNRMPSGKAWSTMAKALQLMV